MAKQVLVYTLGEVFERLESLASEEGFELSLDVDSRRVMFRGKGYTVAELSGTELIVGLLGTAKENPRLETHGRQSEDEEESDEEESDEEESDEEEPEKRGMCRMPVARPINGQHRFGTFCILKYGHKGRHEDREGRTLKRDRTPLCVQMCGEIVHVNPPDCKGMNSYCVREPSHTGRHEDSSGRIKRRDVSKKAK